MQILRGDCLAILPTLPANSIDAVLTDPPYHLSDTTRRFSLGQIDGRIQRRQAGFMGKQWDGGDVAFRPETWAEVLRVLKPGAHMLVFGGTRTFHRMACAIEDAGFEIRDTLMWLYGSGFPKSHDISKAIDRKLGAEREVIGIKPGHEEFANRATRGHIDFKDGTEGFDRPWMHDDEARARYHILTAPATPEAAAWAGWGSALKPAYEPILLCRKPLEGTLAANTLAYGVGGLNIDDCRVPATDKTPAPVGQFGCSDRVYDKYAGHRDGSQDHMGRWPANIILSDDPEVVDLFPQTTKAGNTRPQPAANDTSMFGIGEHEHNPKIPGDNGGSAARFFYCSKASKKDRCGSKHPTVKPIALLRYLIRLITPPGGTVLDPFAGSGTTGQAAMELGFDCVLIEREAEYIADIERRLSPTPTSRG